MTTASRKSIMVIDPGVHTPELDTFNLIAALSPVSCSYHLPAMFGFGSFPSELSELAAVIVLGSAASVYEGLEWQMPLESFVAQAVDAGVPILGCCYGHQMLAHMFGGQVGFVRESREKLKGVRRVNILPNHVWSAGERDFIVTHAEMVTQMPAEFDVLATSKEVAIDGMMHRSKPIFGFQSHPEATRVFLMGHEMLSNHAENSLADGHEILRGFVHMACSDSK